MWWHLRAHLPPAPLEQVRHMRLCADGCSAVFDVPSAMADMFVSAFEKHRFVSLTTATALPELSTPPSERPGGRVSMGRGSSSSSSYSSSSSTASFFSSNASQSSYGRGARPSGSAPMGRGAPGSASMGRGGFGSRAPMGRGGFNGAAPMGRGRGAPSQGSFGSFGRGRGR